MASWSQGNSFTAAPGLPFLSHGLLYNIPYGFTLEEDLFVDAIPYYQIDPHKYKDKKVVR
jgi:hypothetical protein